MADKRAKDTTKKNKAARGENAPPAPASDEERTEAAPAASDEQQSALGSNPAAGAASGASDAGESDAQGGQGQPGGEVFEIAVLPLQQTTLFPGTVIPLSAGRPRSVAAVEAALATEEKLLACITVREGRAAVEAEATPPADLFEVGTLVMVKRMMRTPEGLQLIVHGTERVRVVK